MIQHRKPPSRLRRARALCRPDARCPLIRAARSDAQGPDISGRSALAQAAAESLDSRLGHRRVRSTRRITSGSCTAAGLADRAHRGRPGDQSADRGERAARRRRPCSSSIRRERSSATGAAPVRDTTGRGRRRASPSTPKGNVWIAGTAPQLRSGLAGAAQPLPPTRRPRAQVHPRRQVPAADRPAPARARAASARPR